MHTCTKYTKLGESYGSVKTVAEHAKVDIVCGIDECTGIHQPHV